MHHPRFRCAFKRRFPPWAPIACLFAKGMVAVAARAQARAPAPPNGPRVERSARADLSYDVRQEVSAVLLPSHDFEATGTCATGAGVAPASVYAPGVSGRGVGVGAGVGGRLAYQRPTRAPSAARPTWWGFRAGGGLDVSLLYARVPTGADNLSDALCARLKREGLATRYRGSSVLFLQAPLVLGAELGLGQTQSDGAWHGIVLGAAWAGAISYFQPAVTRGDFSASYLGSELTLDFVTLRPDATGGAGADGDTRQPGMRAALFLLLPPQDAGPIVLTASFGAVWY